MIPVRPRNFTGAKSISMHRGHFFVAECLLSSSAEQNSTLPGTWKASLSNSRIEPKTAAPLTGVVGQLTLFGGHVVIEHFNVTVQAQQSEIFPVLGLHG